MGPWHVPWYLPTLLASGHAGLQGGLARELIVTTRQVLPLPLSEQRQPTSRPQQFWQTNHRIFGTNYRKIQMPSLYPSI